MWRPTCWGNSAQERRTQHISGCYRGISTSPTEFNVHTSHLCVTDQHGMLKYEVVEDRRYLNPLIEGRKFLINFFSRGMEICLDWSCKLMNTKFGCNGIKLYWTQWYTKSDQSLYLPSPRWRGCQWACSHTQYTEYGIMTTIQNLTTMWKTKFRMEGGYARYCFFATIISREMRC